jgi:hypothetical protein
MAFRWSTHPPRHRPRPISDRRPAERCTADPDRRPRLLLPVHTRPSNARRLHPALTHPVVRTVGATLLALVVLALALWWILGRDGRAGAEVRQPGIGARLATPDVVWPDGTPQGGHENSEWARAVREWNLAYAVAYNARDISDATFADLSSATLRQAVVDDLLSWIDLGGGPYQIGPQPMTITDITEDGDRATVTTCEFMSGWDATRADEAEEKLTKGVDPPAGSTVHYTVERRADDSLTVTRVEAPDSPLCDLDDARIAYFDPAPPYGTRTQPWEVIGTDGQPAARPPSPDEQPSP